MTKNRKFKAYWGASIYGFVAFLILAFKLNPEDLVIVSQFFFGYEGLVAAGFFGFNFGEHWTQTKKLPNNNG